MDKDGLRLVNPEQLHFTEVVPDEYAKVMAPDIVRFYDDMGLDPTFMPILTKHIKDIHLLRQQGGAATTRLDVRSTMTDEGDREWYRAAIFNNEQLETYRDNVFGVLDQRDIGDTKEDRTILSEKLAVNWLFYELSADAVANSYSLQQRYDAYIPDWNGQASCYMAQFAISESFFQEYAQDADVHAVARDHESFRAGVSLLQLRDDLLRMGVVKHDTVAGWVVHDLAEVVYPQVRGDSQDHVRPLGREEIMLRLSCLVPREGFIKDMADYVGCLGDPEDDVW